MRRIILCAGLLWSAAAFAQNLNPTVEVTNIYAREASGIEKPSQLGDIPDSLTRFNLDFDYAVNETPYQGAYEFTPYLVQPKPSARPVTERNFYLSLGAGYTLHPEFALVWTPVKTQKFRLNLFGDHYSYWGEYHTIALNADGIFAPDGTTRKGKELHSRAGVDALLNWRRGALRADVQYNNVVATDFSAADAMHHVARASARVQNIPGTTKVDYSVGTRAAMIWAPQGLLQETHTLTDASLGARIFRHNLGLRFQLETVNQPEGNAASFQITPRYNYAGKRFSLVLGLKAAFLLRSVPDFIPTQEGYLFPDVQANLVLVKDYLDLYASITGGNELMSYDTFLQMDSFIAGTDWYTDVKKQRVLAVLGLRGNIGKRFYYDVKGGYSLHQNTWTWSYNPNTSVPSVCYAGDLQSLMAVANVGWKNHFLSADAFLKYVYTMNKPQTINPAGQVFFIPARWQGRARIFYNWGSRLSAGVTLEGRSTMTSKQGSIPGYLDLGLQASFRMSSRTGLWIKAGNLLNQAVQRVPFYAEKGIYGSLGFTLNL